TAGHAFSKYAFVLPQSSPSPYPKLRSVSSVRLSGSGLKSRYTSVRSGRMAGIVGGAFHSNTSCSIGRTLWTLHPSLPREPSGDSTPNHSSNAPPGHGSTFAALGAQKLSMPFDVVHDFQTSATGALIV